MSDGLNDAASVGSPRSGVIWVGSNTFGGMVDRPLRLVGLAG